MVMSKSIKRHILEILLRQMVQSIKESGILDEAPETYLASLKAELDNRRQELATAIILRDLRHDEVEVRRQAIEKLLPRSDEPRIQKALRIRAKKETDPELLKLIHDLLEDSTDESAAAIDFSSELFWQKPVRDQLAHLKNISGSEFSEIKPSLLPRMTDTTPRPVFVRILKLFQEFGSVADVEVLLALLKSKDPATISLALRALARIDFDTIATVINPLLRSDNLAIKAAALEVYIECDEEGAKQYLASMLLSPVASIRRKALTLTPLVDLAAIEKELIIILSRDSHPDIQAQAGAVLASNPSAARLKFIYAMTHQAVTQPVKELTELWESVRPLAAGFFDLPAAELDGWLKTALAEEGLPEGYSESAASEVARVIDKESEKQQDIDILSIILDRDNLSLVGVFAVVFFLINLVQEPPWAQNKPYLGEKTAVEKNSDSIKPVARKPSATKATPRARHSGGWKVLPQKWSGDPGRAKPPATTDSTTGENE